MNRLALYVTYTAKHGMGESFVKEIVSKGILEKILHEDGCLGYEYYYSAENKDKILLAEQWDSEEHQRLHMSQPHMDELRAVKERCIDSADIKKFLL